jgi:protein O-mannosyl-transferase
MKKIPKIKYYLAAAAALITFIVYLPVLNNDFLLTWDDNGYIVRNPYIRSFDLGLIKWAFTDFTTGNWHPLTWMSHALDYAIWGLNPAGHHLTSIIFHAVNTFLVTLLTIELTAALRERKIPDAHSPSLDEPSTWIAAVVAGLLFGLHPLHVESVAWASERKDLLCALFFLLSIAAYLNYVRGADSAAGVKKVAPQFFNKHYLYAVGFFIFALSSKSMAVTLPLVLLILDWYPLNRMRQGKSIGTLLAEKLPFISLSLVFSILTVAAQEKGGAMGSLEYTSLSTRVLVGSEALVSYLGKMIWPATLSPFYPYPNPETVSLWTFEYGLAVVLVVGITALCLGMVRKHRLWLSVWSYYVVTLAPVLGIVQVGSQSMADRYTYLPSLGPFLATGLAAAWVVKKINMIRKGRTAARIVGVAVAVSLFVALSYLTVKQVGIWKDSTRFWFYIIEHEPGTLPR